MKVVVCVKTRGGGGSGIARLGCNHTLNKVLMLKAAFVKSGLCRARLHTAQGLYDDVNRNTYTGCGEGGECECMLVPGDARVGAALCWQFMHKHTL
jgi:hypothetical protein